jgi:CRP-like cAMP-binding protein
MYESLVKYIRNHSTTQLSEEAITAITSLFVPKKIRKNQYFLQEGEVCKYSAFIVKGAMRQYTVDDRGVEHIVNLSIENWWALDRESWVMHTPSNYYIDAWENTELLLITRADAIALVNHCPAFNEMIRLLDERHDIATQKRLTSSISFSAEERYADFANCHPYFLQRFPQYIIASYLGITKDTLSRVRKSYLKK